MTTPGVKFLKQSSTLLDLKILMHISVERRIKKLKATLIAARVAAAPALSTPHRDKGLTVSRYCWDSTSHGRQAAPGRSRRGRSLPLFGKGLSFLRTGEICMFPLTKQKFFAVIENASVAGNPRLTCPEGPHLPRPLPLGVFLSDQEVRWGQNKMKHR